MNTNINSNAGTPETSVTTTNSNKLATQTSVHDNEHQQWTNKQAALCNQQDTHLQHSSKSNIVSGSSNAKTQQHTHIIRTQQSVSLYYQPHKHQCIGKTAISLQPITQTSATNHQNKHKQHRRRKHPLTWHLTGASFVFVARCGILLVFLSLFYVIFDRWRWIAFLCWPFL